jgi:hypothetical protein
MGTPARSALGPVARRCDKDTRAVVTRHARAAAVAMRLWLIGMLLADPALVAVYTIQTRLTRISDGPSMEGIHTFQASRAVPESLADAIDFRLETFGQ